VNENHLRMLASPRWAEMLRTQVLPRLESVDPDDLPQRLGAIGFTDVEVELGELDFRFHACKPG
jgi:hypothetical protein